MSMKTYRQRVMLETAYCDMRGDAKISQLLAAAQQISQLHCQAAGVGDDFFRGRGLAFLMAKLRLDIYKTPSGLEEIELFTQPNLPTRAQYRRVTDFLGGNGELYCKLDSRWILVEMQTRKVLRRRPEDIELPFLDAGELPDLRASMPDTMTLRESVTVRYSMLDLNGHMNNTVYGDIVCNLLEHRLLCGERIAALELFYHREALSGDRLSLYLAEDGDRFFVRGELPDAVCFEAAGRLVPV